MRSIIQIVSTLVVLAGFAVVVLGLVTISGGASRADYGPFVALAGVWGMAIGISLILGGGITYMVCQIDIRLEDLLDRSPDHSRGVGRQDAHASESESSLI